MIVIPSAAVPTITVCTAIVRQLYTLRNDPESRVKKANSSGDQDQAQERPEDRPDPAERPPESGRALLRADVVTSSIAASTMVASRIPLAQPDARQPPVATSINDCSVHSAIGRASLRTPRVMTASRSQMPNSSGRYELTMTIALPSAASSPIRR